ncbi:hypothetical protein [Sedimentibacter sp. MB31-C6]|uniref:hypothetical protein n=1 Tax=Sedimentibacter sp. MB31-C6 TaxID=3109366 RepID=UPI002DDD13E0|nr:hypothetical protein [Sedimentibacter sp. MB36-C1]WSI04028.1 hypothetical protein U8307_13660 [Sedimentibacter sp. MB36-C1]
MNIKYIQKLLSRINEVRIIGKNVEIDGVVCNIAGIVRYGQKLRLIILEYDDMYRRKIEEMEVSEPSEIRQQETNRSILKGRGRIEAAQSFKTIKSVSIGEMGFDVDFTENRLLDFKDGESVLFLSELLRNGWIPEGVDYQNIDMLFLTSIELAGDYTEIPKFEHNAKLHFTMNKNSVSYLVEQPLTLAVNGEYTDKLWFKNTEDSEENWVQINRVYLMDIWCDMEKNFSSPKLLEHMTKGQIEEAKRNIKKSLIEVCPKGMYYPVIEYESEEDISLEFHTKEFLDSKPVHHGNGSIGFIIRPDKATGILGKKLKSAIIQEPVSENTESIEAELFQYYKTIIPKDVILPTVNSFNEIRKDYMKVNVKEVAERLDMQFDDYRYFLDIRTAEIFEIEERFLEIAEESDEDDNFDEYLDWEKNDIHDGISFFQEQEYYISLPSKFDIHECQIMEDFIDSLTNESYINRLERAITGRGAFRRFKDTINYLGIEKNWYDFKEKALEKKLIEWCKDNDLEYE